MSKGKRKGAERRGRKRCMMGKAEECKADTGNAVDGGMLYFYPRERTAQQHGDTCDLRRIGPRAGRVACECCRCMPTGRH